MGVVVDEVEVVKVASLVKNNLYQFMHVHTCFLASLRPNLFIKFRLANASKPPLTNSPSLLKLKAWADLFALYPEGFGIHLSMIFQFGVELGYKSPSNAFILLENLTSAFEDLAIIEKKLQEDLTSGRVTPVQQPGAPFIYSLLGLMSKHDGGWRKIQHFLYPCGELVNDYILDGDGKTRYTRFQEVLQMVTRTSRH